MAENIEQATEVVISKTETENGEETKQATNENGTSTHYFGVVDLWKIRRRARTFRIHNRIPRL